MSRGMESGTPVRPWPEQFTVWWSGHKQLVGQFWPCLSKVENNKARKGFNQLIHSNIVKGGLSINHETEGSKGRLKCRSDRQMDKQVTSTEEEGEEKVKHCWLS